MPAEADDHPATPRVAHLSSWVLDDMLERAERRGRAIHARGEWIAARRRELRERRDRLRDEIGPGAGGVDGHDPGAPPAAVAPLVPASPPPGPSAAILKDLADRVDALLGIVRGPERRAQRADGLIEIVSSPEFGEVWDDAPRPAPAMEAAAAL
ncbi:hypothetical protein [Longimicrobium sp.]|uniref:hypothetical protein n=1 Tax=Longimicrobium sp. TaxID=2029185 RepID=UPI003B3BCAAB